MESGTKLEWNKVFKEIILGKDKNVAQGSSLGKACSNAEQISEDKLNLDPKPPKDMPCPFTCNRTAQAPYKSNANPSHSSQTYLLNKKSSTECCNKTKGAPAWDNAFKDILGATFSNEACCENECIPAPVPFKPVKSKTFYPKKKPFQSSKSKRNKEIEKEVEMLFESWKALKEPEPEYSLNDFDGAGINIFKYSSDQKDKFYVPKQNPPKPPIPKEDPVSCSKRSVSRQFQKKITGHDSAIRNGWKNSSCQQDSGFVSKPLEQKGRCHISRENQTKELRGSSPLKGFVAIRPYNKSSPTSQKGKLEECWDDDFKL